MISIDLHLHECINTKLENTLTVKDPPLLDKASFLARQREEEVSWIVPLDSTAVGKTVKCIRALRTQSKHPCAKCAIRSRQASRPAAIKKEGSEFWLSFTHFVTFCFPFSLMNSLCFLSSFFCFPSLATHGLNSVDICVLARGHMFVSLDYISTIINLTGLKKQLMYFNNYHPNSSILCVRACALVFMSHRVTHSVVLTLWFKCF